jgi:hypothetical protein
MNFANSIILDCPAVKSYSVYVHKLLLLVTLAGAAGCSGQMDADPDPFRPTPWYGVRECSYTLSPEPSLMEWTRRAAVRWEKATGCTIQALETKGGIPVFYVDEIVMPTDGDDPDQDPDRAFGVITPKVHPETREFLYWKDIKIAEYTPNPLRTLTHELGHLLGAWHGSGSVMSGGHLIDDGCVMAACSKSACPGPLSPEVAPAPLEMALGGT